MATGVVWFDEGTVFFERHGFGKTRLGHRHVPVPTPGGITSSASAVVVGAGHRANAEEDDPLGFFASVPPGPFESIRYPPLFAGAGCKGWEPNGARVLAGARLVVAGQCFWSDRFSHQPLFIKSLRAGRWHVLRWLPGEYEPILAAEGSLLAIGVQHSLAQMTVSILNLRDGRIRANFTLPDGYLSFASRGRLVLSSPALKEQGDVCFPVSQPCQPYRISLFSIHGKRIAELGTSREPPLVSHMHVVVDEYHEGPGNPEDQTLSVYDLAGSPSGGSPGNIPRSVIGFNPPARALVALAFRWPALAVIDTTSAPRLPSEIHCWSGEYKAPGKPFLKTFDLARDEPFLPAPAIVQVQPSKPLTNCGPPPP